MKKVVATLASVLLLSAASTAEVTKEDLKKLAAAQVADRVVVAYVRSHGPMPKLSAQDLIELKNAGVSEKVLEEVASGDPKPASASVRTEGVERRIHVISPPPVVYVPHAGYRPWRPWVRIGFCW
jgi:hypothetical protein